MVSPAKETSPGLATSLNPIVSSSHPRSLPQHQPDETRESKPEPSKDRIQGGIASAGQGAQTLPAKSSQQGPRRGQGRRHPGGRNTPRQVHQDTSNSQILIDLEDKPQAQNQSAARKRGNRQRPNQTRDQYSANQQLLHQNLTVPLDNRNRNPRGRKAYRGRKQDPTASTANPHLTDERAAKTDKSPVPQAESGNNVEAKGVVESDPLTSLHNDTAGSSHQSNRKPAHQNRSRQASLTQQSRRTGPRKNMGGPKTTPKSPSPFVPPHRRFSLTKNRKDNDVSNANQALDTPPKSITEGDPAAAIKAMLQSANHTTTPPADRKSASHPPNVLNTNDAHSMDVESKHAPAFPEATKATTVESKGPSKPSRPLGNTGKQKQQVSFKNHRQVAPATQNQAQNSQWDNNLFDQWQSKRKSKWAKPPKHQPNDGPTWSEYGSGGWGSELARARRLNDEADPERDVRMLIDWEGKWLPPPESWEGRRGYHNTNLFETLEKWMDKIEEKQGMPLIKVLEEPLYNELENGEIAPRCWIPDTIEESPVQIWWLEHLRGPLARECCNPDDKPWWTTYVTEVSNTLTPKDIPTPRLDPTDECYQRSQEDQGNLTVCLQGQIRKNKRRQERKEAREHARQLMAKRLNVPPIIPEDDTTIHPKVDLYLRPVYPSDVAQLVDIYNWQIEHTVHAPEMNPCTPDAMLAKIRSIRDNRLPCIVAVEKNPLPVPAQPGHHGHVPYVPQTGSPEKIIGFALTKDYGAMRNSAYRYTGDIEIYTRPDYRLRGVANCLLDKLLFCLDLLHTSRGGYEWRSSEFTTAGGLRVLGKVMCHVPYDPDEPKRITFMDRWLGQHGFRRVGELQEIGFKLHKKVSLAIYQMKTSSILDPKTAL